MNLGIVMPPFLRRLACTMDTQQFALCTRVIFFSRVFFFELFSVCGCNSSGSIKLPLETLYAKEVCIEHVKGLREALSPLGDQFYTATDPLRVRLQTGRSLVAHGLIILAPAMHAKILQP